MKKTHVALGILAMAAFVGSSTTGCSSDGDPATGGGGSGTGDGGAGPGPGPGPGGSGGTGGTGGTGGGGGMDESTSCADAPMMEAGMGQLNNPLFVGNGFLATTGDRDFWKFDASAGDWLQIITQANPDDDQTFIDTVIRLHDESGNTLLATVDDAYPRGNTTDSTMFHHIAADGTYCLEVLEFGDWVGSPVDKANNQYSTQVIPISFADFDGFDEDVEPNDVQAMANTNLSTTNPQMNNPMSPYVGFQFLGGTFEDATDTDWFELVVPADGATLSLDLTPEGVGADGGNATSGFGSTGGAGAINLRNSMGVLVASVNNQLLQDGLDGMSSVPVAAGNYFLEVTRPAGATAGANDFYWTRLLIGDDTAVNPQETSDVTNNLITGAEIMQANPIDQNGFISHFIGGTVLDGDSDFWAFPSGGEPMPGEELTVACSSWAAGSGVRGMTVTHYDNGTAGQTQVEDEAKGVVWSSGGIGFETDNAITITTAGPHVIEISNDVAMPDAAAISRHYLCGIRRNTMP